MTIYLDNAASSCPKPAAVVEAVESCLRNYCANPGRGAHKLAVEAARIIYQARQKAADLLGVADSANIIFTQNATDALNLAMRGLVSPGDHVISSTVEHNAVARPLKALAGDGVETTLVAPDADGYLDPDAIAAAIRPQTRLAALTHVSNVTAAVQPVSEIGRALAEKGVPLLLDAAQSAGAVPMDMGEMPVAMLACTGHKSLMAPQGIGLLYISPDIELRSVRQGGTGTRSEAEQDELSRPDRYECGTLNTPGIAGLGAGIDFVMQEGVAELAAQKALLTEQLYSGLVAVDGVDVYGPPPGKPRGAMVTFNIAGMLSTETAATLDREFDIASRAGLHCAPGAHRSLGTLERGAVRFSLGPFNTENDVAAALTAVAAIAAAR